MKTVLQLQSQDVRKRGPAKYVPRCDPKLRPKKEDTIVPKIHLSFIPPSLRRPSPWGAFLSDWLASCEEKRSSASSSSDASTSVDSPTESSPRCTYPEDEAGSTTSGRSSSSSGACSGDTVTTDFSSVSSPRKTIEYRTASQSVIRQPQPPTARHAFRGAPRAASTAANLSPAQWAELAALQQTAVRQQQQRQAGGGGAHHYPGAHSPPPKLMNIHTAYFPDLDAAVLQMMQQQKPAPAPAASTRPPSSPSGQPWQPHSYYYPTDQRYSIRGASTASSDSAHYSDCRGDRAQPTCDFCYQFAVHEAVSKAGAPMPRLSDRGPWRGHPTKQGETIVCPRLLRRVCSMCGATGQSAHLTNLCPVTNRKTSRY